MGPKETNGLVLSSAPLSLGARCGKLSEAARAQAEFEFACRLGSTGACAALETAGRAIPAA